jgi:hypothetical protein
MDLAKNTASKKIIKASALGLIAFVLAILSTRPEMRALIHSNSVQTREVLGKIFTEFDQKSYVILKVKTESGIEIEIFEKDTDNNQKLKQKFSLIDDSEAYLMINNNSVNLGLNDIDHDGIVDIIAPTVDQSGNSRLNIYKFNSELNQFIPLQPNE